MKKLFALLAVAALAFPVVANAGLAQKWVSAPVQWRTLGSGVAVDSSVFRTVGTQTTYDTTAAFPLAQAELWEMPRVPDTAVDSTLYLAFHLYPTATTALTADADSFLLVTQVSMDGASWVTVTPNQVFDATRPAGLRGAVFVENNSLNGFSEVYKNTIAITTIPSIVLDGATAPTDLQMFGWRFVRWIVQTCGGQGEFSAFVNHWSSDR